MLGVALLAGLLFLGGGAAIYLSSPGQPATPTNLVADASGTPTLPPFVQDTPTPTPTAIPTPALPTFTFFPPPSLVPTESPTFEVTPTPTPTHPTDTPNGPSAPKAKFSAAQGTNNYKIFFTDNSSGQVTSWSWDFGDGGSSTQQNPKHNYGKAGEFRAVLTVTGPGGSAHKVHTIHVTDFATPTPTPTPKPTPPSTSPSTPDAEPPRRRISVRRTQT